jgi:hypothetical protein
VPKWIAELYTLPIVSARSSRQQRRPLYQTLANDLLVALDRITFLTAVTIVKCGFYQPSSTGSTLILSGPLLLRALRMAAASLTA